MAETGSGCRTRRSRRVCPALLRTGWIDFQSAHERKSPRVPAGRAAGNCVHQNSSTSRGDLGQNQGGTRPAPGAGDTGKARLGSNLTAVARRPHSTYRRADRAARQLLGLHRMWVLVSDIVPLLEPERHSRTTRYRRTTAHSSDDAIDVTHTDRNLAVFVIGEQSIRRIDHPRLEVSRTVSDYSNHEAGRRRSITRSAAVFVAHRPDLAFFLSPPIEGRCVTYSRSSRMGSYR